MKHRSPIVASTLKFGDSAEMAVASNGELNASSKKDLLLQQQKFIQAMASQGVVTEADAVRRQEIAKAHKAALAAAMHDKRAAQELGEVMAQELYQTMNRKGYARKFLARQELTQGMIPRANMRRKDVTAIWSTSATRLASQIVRDKVLTPPEISIEARPFIQQNDINQASGDVLEEKYMEALEAIMVQEDRMWYNAANATVGIDNPSTLISGTLTPLTLAQIQQRVASWGLRVTSILMANDLYADIIGDSTFIQAIEPVARHELLMTGELGVLYGMTITSDATRHPEHKVLNQGEFFCVADPVTHGQYTDRGGIETLPIDGAIEGIPGRGWMMSEQFSMVIANSRSVAKATRV